MNKRASDRILERLLKLHPKIIDLSSRGRTPGFDPGNASSNLARSSNLLRPSGSDIMLRQRLDAGAIPALIILLMGAWWNGIHASFRH